MLVLNSPHRNQIFQNELRFAYELVANGDDTLAIEGKSELVTAFPIDADLEECLEKDFDAILNCWAEVVSSQPGISSLQRLATNLKGLGKEDPSI